MPQISNHVDADRPSLVSLSLPHSTWLGRHAEWLKVKMVSQNTLERISAKVWAYVFPLFLWLSIVFTPQSYQFYAYLKTEPLVENDFSFIPFIPIQNPSEGVSEEEDEPLQTDKIYFDGDCENFLRKKIYAPYLKQLKNHIDQNPLLNTQINQLEDSPFKAKAQDLYHHLSKPPVSQEMYRSHQKELIEKLRAYQIESHSLRQVTDHSILVIITAFDQFVQFYMKDIDCYQPGINFLQQIAGKEIVFNEDQDLASQLDAIYQQLKENTNCEEALPILYDPFLLGNNPFQTFKTTLNQKTINFFRCPNILKDEEMDGNLLTKASVGEQFKLYLDACHREGKKHLYVNFMVKYGQANGRGESLRSRLIEELEGDYCGTLNVVSLDRNSNFYHQRGEYEGKNDAETFKINFKTNLNNDNFYYWSQELNRFEWQKKLDSIIEEVHHCNFNSNATLNLELRQCFIELVYIKIVEELLVVFNSDNCNLSCKSCIDRGSVSFAIMFLHNLKDKIDSKRFKQLLFLTFAPALLVANRPLQLQYFNKIIVFIKTFIKSNVVSCDLEGIVFN